MLISGLNRITAPSRLRCQYQYKLVTQKNTRLCYGIMTQGASQQQDLWSIASTGYAGRKVMVVMRYDCTALMTQNKEAL